ncbi:hypothetical protein OAE25_00905 [Verrucomicrobiales bacterium]|nr:hypothetical protein [Verrucomicrobiales bacterium]
MAHLQSTTISGSINDSGSLQITGSTLIPPFIESSLTSSFSSSGLLWINADNFNLQYTTETSKGTIQSPASFMGSWSAGGTMITSRKALGAAGTGVSSTLVFGGCRDGASKQTATEHYNGTSWSSGGALGTATYVIAGTGTENAALAVGGRTNSGDTNQVCDYGGSSWSTTGNMINTAHMRKPIGTQNASFIFGGPPGGQCKSEFWQGSNSYQGPDLLVENAYGMGFGSVGDAISYQDNTTQIYDGQTWTYGANGVNGESTQNGGIASGTSTSTGFVAGGDNGSIKIDSMMEYNGISWVNSCTMPAAVYEAARGSNGSSDSTVLAGGRVSNTIQGNSYHYEKNDILPYTSAVWSNGAANILVKSGGKGAGDANAALSFGGIITPTSRTCTEEYDGTQWSAGGAMIHAVGNHGGTGTANAALAAGGEPATCTKAEEYNGTSWSAGGNLSQGGYGNSTLGTQNAAINFGGNLTKGKKAETYNGTAWSGITDMNCCRRAAAGGAGTSNAGLVFGGRCYTAPTTCQLTLSEEWNGSSWSFGGSYTTIRSNGIAGGQTIDTALSTGGYNPTSPAGTFTTELYDGTSWSAGTNALNIMKYSAGYSIGASAFATQGNPQNNISQFYNAVCSSTLCSSLPVWSGVASMLAHTGYSAAFGTQNAAAVTTGINVPGAAATFATEEWDGTNWSSGGANQNQTGQATGRVAMGTLNAGLLTGGWPTQKWTEEYNGTSWSAANEMSICRNSSGASGTQTAALVAGGAMTYPNKTNATEEYDGTNWSSGGALSTARYLNVSAGTQNDTVTAGGYTSTSGTTCVEEYNGSSWSTGGTLPVGKGDTTGNMFGVGIYDATFAAGYNPTRFSSNIQYDGSVWAYRPSAPIAVNASGKVGTSNAGLLTGGRTGYGYTNTVFEYNNTINSCISTWTVEGNLSTARYALNGAGTSNAALAIAGFTSPVSLTTTEEFDGSTWAAGGAVINCREGGGAAGTQNSTVFFGGRTTPANANRNFTEEYDGSSWAAGGAMIIARAYNFGGAGTQNAAIGFGGATPTVGAYTETYNGSSWSAGTCMINSRMALASAQNGTQNSALAFGGYRTPSCSASSCVESWNGSAWTTENALPTVMSFGAGAGNGSEDAVRMGGNAPGISTDTQQYNGFTWITFKTLPEKSYYNAAAGGGNALLHFGSRPTSAHTYKYSENSINKPGISVNRTEVSAT